MWGKFFFRRADWEHGQEFAVDVGRWEMGREDVSGFLYF